MAIIDRAKQQPAYEVIGKAINVDPKTVKKSRYDAANYNRPPLFVVTDKVYCAPVDNTPPGERDWRVVDETAKRKVFYTDSKEFGHG